MHKLVCREAASVLRHFTLHQDRADVPVRRGVARWVWLLFKEKALPAKCIILIT